jgi:hypothetical protein
MESASPFILPLWLAPVIPLRGGQKSLSQRTVDLFKLLLLGIESGWEKSYSPTPFTTDPATPSNLAGFRGRSSTLRVDEPTAVRTYARNTPKARIYINVVLERFKINYRYIVSCSLHKIRNIARIRDGDANSNRVLKNSDIN